MRKQASDTLRILEQTLSVYAVCTSVCVVRLKYVCVRHEFALSSSFLWIFLFHAWRARATCVCVCVSARALLLSLEFFGLAKDKVASWHICLWLHAHLTVGRAFHIKLRWAYRNSWKPSMQLEMALAYEVRSNTHEYIRIYIFPESNNKYIYESACG